MKTFCLIVCFLLAGICQISGQSKIFVASAGKLASLTVGEKFVDLSKQGGEGLYNRVETEKVEDPMNGDYVTHTLYWNGTKVAVVTIEDPSSEIISRVCIYSDKVQTSKGIKKGMLLSQALKIAKAEKIKWYSTFADGQGVSIVCDGHRVEVREDCLSDSGKEKASSIIEEGVIDLQPCDLQPDISVLSFYL